MHRRHLALLSLLALVTVSGCTGLFGPEPVDSDQLNENASYDWDTETDVSIVLDGRSYQSVYALPDNSSFTVYERDGLGRDQSIEISALRFRYDNGTVIRPANSTLSANQTGQATIIDLPDNASGQLAFTAPRNGKSFSTPVHRSGATYSVSLPPTARVGIPLLSNVSPGGYETTVDEESNRQTIRWSEPVDAGAISLSYYLQRDLLIFGGLTLVAVIVGTAGTVHYWRQLQDARRRRKEAGLDLEQEDEDDDPTDQGPPPGMR